MTKIFFVRTAYHYSQYQDFFRLAALSGFYTIDLADIPKDAPDSVFIISPYNDEWCDGVETSGRVIHWDLEWRDEAPKVPGLFETWASDRWYADRNGCRFVPMGSHKDLVPTFQTYGIPKYDVTWQAYEGPDRRQRVFAPLKGMYKVGPNAWSRKRDEILGQTALLVHVHQHDEWPCLPSLRFAFAASAYIPVLSERVKDPFPYVHNEVLFVPYEELLSRTIEYLAPEAKIDREDRSRMMWNTAVLQYPFEGNVIEALKGALA